MTADQISMLVDAQLKQFEDARSVRRFRELQVLPRVEERAWDYGPPGQKCVCWIVFEHRKSNIGIGYCAEGFGPRCPWGLLFLDGDERLLGMGMDSGWFSNLEDAFRDTLAFTMERPWQITNENEWINDCKEVVRVSTSILNSSIGITEGTRLLAALRFRVRAEDDPDFLLFTGIDSETHHFPLGEDRTRWESGALARYDAERARTEAHLRSDAEKACRSLIQKYGNVS